MHSVDIECRLNQVKQQQLMQHTALLLSGFSSFFPQFEYACEMIWEL